MAKDNGTDLVEISAKALPPIVKLIDYGKYQYAEKKKARLQKELNNFVVHLQTLTAQSHHLLASLRASSDRKQAEKIVRKLKKS